MAREASAFDISTKPKPRGRPVSRSTISVTFSTVPCLANRARTASSVAVNGRFPTYSLVTEEYSRINGDKPAGQTCFLVREACEGERVAGGGRRWARCGQHRQAERSRPSAQGAGFSAALLYFKAAIRTLPAPVHRCAGDDRGIQVSG